MGLMLIPPVSSDYLEREVLRPFSKTESFTPGSGLGLGLAQRMIELLGGKLAIASELHKGTIVHIEVPLHLFNEDNESDQDELEERGEGVTPVNMDPTFDPISGSGSGVGASGTAPGGRQMTALSPEKVRQDGIYLVGFEGSPSIKRAGRSVLRQLKMHFCRVVPDIQYANLIVAPTSVDRTALIALAKKAREGVEIVLIGDRQPAQPMYRRSRKPSQRGSPSQAGSAASSADPSASEASDAEADKGKDQWEGISVHTVYRPIRPSVMEEIMRPTRQYPAYEPPLPPSGHVSPPDGGPSSGLQSPTAAVTNPPSHTHTPPLSGHTYRPPIDPLMRAGRPERPCFTRMETSMTDMPTGTESTTPSTSLPSISGTISGMTEEDILPSPVGSGHGSPESPGLGEMRLVPPLLKAEGELHANAKVGRRASKRASTDSRVGGGGEIEDVIAGVDRVRLDEKSLPSLPSFSEDSSVQSAGGEEGSSAPGDPADIDTENEVPMSSEAPSESDLEPPVEKDPGPLRVLVVEDNDVNRKILTTMLRRTSCDFAEAKDGIEAIERYDEFLPHLVLLDINMPRKDGFQAAWEIREMERKRHKHPSRPKLTSRASASNAEQVTVQDSSAKGPPPSGEGAAPLGSAEAQGDEAERPAQSKMKCRIIAVTAMSSEAHRRKGMVECGIDTWLAKPVGIKKLKEEIERAKRDMIEPQPSTQG